MKFQVRENLRVAVNQPREQFRVELLPVGNFVFGPEIFARHGDQSFDLKLIRAHQQVQHLLLFIRLIAHVGEDDQARTVGHGCEGGLAGKNDQKRKDERGELHGLEDFAPEISEIWLWKSRFRCELIPQFTGTL